MTARTFTTAVLFAVVAGSGWIAGLGLQARSAVREMVEPGLAGPAVAVASGIRLGGPAMAGGDAAATPGVPVLRIFGDYECPACRALEREVGDSLRALADGGLIVLEYHHRPLSSHVRGRLAAEVAYCGAAAGYAAVVHDALGRSVEVWARGSEPLSAMLETVGTPDSLRAALEACIEGGRMVDAVDADRRLADSLAVTAVPTVFLDAARLEFRSYDALVSHVTRRATRPSARGSTRPRG